MKSVLSTYICKHFRFLNPRKRLKERSERSVFRISKAMPLEISSTKVLAEWKLLKIDHDMNASNENLDCQQYWDKIIQLKNAEGASKYPNLGQLPKASCKKRLQLLSASKKKAK